jgi:outer membrane lipoprotein-sorting protein
MRLKRNLNMNRVSLLAGGLLSLSLSTTSVQSAATAAPTPARLSVDQIVDRNLAARGGAAAWRAVKTLTIGGDLDAGGKPNHTLPYVLKEKRPRKSRLEVVFKDQTSLQVYDGSQGWKVRPFLNRNEVETYTPAELKSAAAEQDLDGPLVDYVAKGTQISFVGTEAVEGHPAYKLKLTLQNGGKRNLWIDAGSFLELKMEGEPRKLDGRMHNVAVYFRDYKAEHGLTLPHLQETIVEGTKAPPYKMTITHVAVNESLDDSLFRKPQLAALAMPAPKQPGQP